MSISIEFIDRTARPNDIEDHPEYDFCLYVSWDRNNLDPEIATTQDPAVLMRMLMDFSKGMDEVKNELQDAFEKLNEATFKDDIEVEQGHSYLIFWAKSREDALLAKLVIG